MRTGSRTGSFRYRTGRQSGAWSVVASEVIFVVAWGAMVPGLLWLGRWAGI